MDRKHEPKLWSYGHATCWRGGVTAGGYVHIAESSHGFAATQSSSMLIPRPGPSGNGRNLSSCWGNSPTTASWYQGSSPPS